MVSIGSITFWCREGSWCSPKEWVFEIVRYEDKCWRVALGFIEILHLCDMGSEHLSIELNEIIQKKD